MILATHRSRHAWPAAIAALLACAACSLVSHPEPPSREAVAPEPPAAPTPAARSGGTPSPAAAVAAPKPSQGAVAPARPAAPAKAPAEPKTPSVAARKPATPPATEVAKALPAVPAKPAQPAAAPKPAPLDLKSLEQRLKDTSAIGVMTKLSLKNQVDDLLNQFRDYYAGRLNTTLDALRRPFDLLLMKVLSLLQDSDPALARDIHDSRDALWAILADADRFRKLET